MGEREAVSEKRERRIRWGQSIRVLVAILAIGFLVLFSVLNSDDVNIDYAFGDTDAPMIVVIVVSAVGGFVLGLLAAWRSSRN